MPAARRIKDPGSGTTLFGARKSVALLTFPTITEKAPVSRRLIWLLEKTDSGIDRDMVLGVEPAWFV
jgi:hypothetical protein